MTKIQSKLTVIGAGLAGSEAALAAAEAGLDVDLYEMRPAVMTPAHRSGNFAELVCSNSLGGQGPLQAKGLLQQEMRAARSAVMRSADLARLPAGGALAAEREQFSEYLTREVRAHPRIRVLEEEVKCLPEGPLVIATGPLTGAALSEDLAA